MKYKIIKNVNINELQDEVNKYIKKKWKPLGGIQMHLSDMYDCYLQAMTKNK